MWYCEPFGDLQYMRAREILRQGPLDFAQCRLKRQDDDAKPDQRRDSLLRTRFD